MSYPPLYFPYLIPSSHLLLKYADGLLMALQKQDGGIRPILCGKIWCRCFASLAVTATPVGVRNEAAELFTSTYNFIQTSGIRDGASHCAKILSIFYDNLDTTDPNDPEVIIKIDISNAFSSACRALTIDVLSGRAAGDYDCGLKEGQAIPTCENLSNVFGYFKAVRSCHAKLRYFDWDGPKPQVFHRLPSSQPQCTEVASFDKEVEEEEDRHRGSTTPGVRFHEVFGMNSGLNQRHSNSIELMHKRESQGGAQVGRRHDFPFR